MTAVVHFTFPHQWQAEILSSRPLILPERHFTYPRDTKEVERGALEMLIRPGASSQTAQPFLATCALGFRDPIVPTGIWSCPNPAELCAVSGGYAYLIDTTAPERFTMLPWRPVLEVRPVPGQSLLLFVSHHAILAWGADGLAWQSDKLSDEGVTITAIESDVLHGRGWQMLTDKESSFTLDLRTGRRT
ncbi:MAG TPA: hypothetical protein VKR52_12165 [Terracidiphilus sp.]|nr:hypothetical protein [Terracidiphilus sp.]